jgi:hypothetical protein
MITLNMPGFTAEASFYKTSRYYQNTGSFSRADQLIYPSQQVTPWPVDIVGNISELDTEPTRTYGTVNPGNEDRFNACISSCLAGPLKPSHAACWRTCCRQITGISSCVVA